MLFFTKKNKTIIFTFWSYLVNFYRYLFNFTMFTLVFVGFGVIWCCLVNFYRYLFVFTMFYFRVLLKEISVQHIILVGLVMV